MPPKGLGLCLPRCGTRDLLGTVRGAAGTCRVCCAAPASLTLPVLLTQALADSLLWGGLVPMAGTSATGLWPFRSRGEAHSPGREKTDATSYCRTTRRARTDAVQAPQVVLRKKKGETLKIPFPE